MAFWGKSWRGFVQLLIDDAGLCIWVSGSDVPSEGTMIQHNGTTVILLPQGLEQKAIKTSPHTKLHNELPVDAAV